MKKDELFKLKTGVANPPPPHYVSSNALSVLRDAAPSWVRVLLLFKYNELFTRTV